MEAHLPPDEKGLVDKASANYLRSNGDQALISFFDHLRQMANREPSDQAAHHEALDALWSEFETMRIQHSQDVADRDGAVCGAPCRARHCPSNHSRLVTFAAAPATNALNRSGKQKEVGVEPDVQDILRRTEARLEAIEKLGHQLKEEMAETSANVMASGQMSGADRKLDEILQILKAET
ncbi:MAG: hypothetical protein K0S45_2426 [Nitrospira sp.]|nr:hypothetical protein [Nitrospira sp.]